MYEYLYVLFISLVFIFLLHYGYEKIKESIVYCTHHESYQNYKKVDDILEEISKSETDKENTHTS